MDNEKIINISENRVSGWAFFLMFAIMAMFFSGTPDIADCIMVRLLSGHPEKQALVWDNVMSKIDSQTHR